MNVKMILRIQSQALLTFSVTLLLPIDDALTGRLIDCRGLSRCVMNVKMILRIQSQALLTFSVTLLLPIAYALIEFGAVDTTIFFAATILLTGRLIDCRGAS